MKFFQLRQDVIVDGSAFRVVDVLAECEDDARVLAAEYAAAKHDASADLWLNAEVVVSDEDEEIDAVVVLVAFSDTGA